MLTTDLLNGQKFTNTVLNQTRRKGAHRRVRTRLGRRIRSGVVAIDILPSPHLSDSKILAINFRGSQDGGFGRQFALARNSRIVCRDRTVRPNREVSTIHISNTHRKRTIVRIRTIRPSKRDSRNSPATIRIDIIDRTGASKTTRASKA